MIRTDQDRAAVNLVDAVMTFFVLAGILTLAPIFYRFIDMAAAEADPFSSLLLQLVVPLLFITLLLSVGVSARRQR